MASLIYTEPHYKSGQGRTGNKNHSHSHRQDSKIPFAKWIGNFKRNLIFKVHSAYCSPFSYIIVLKIEAVELPWQGYSFSICTTIFHLWWILLGGRITCTLPKGAVLLRSIPWRGDAEEGLWLLQALRRFVTPACLGKSEKGHMGWKREGIPVRLLAFGSHSYILFCLRFMASHSFKYQAVHHRQSQRIGISQRIPPQQSLCSKNISKYSQRWT